jgi:peptidoglycan L-alanyl-D-glutamate endopeptidase CwlK
MTFKLSQRSLDRMKGVDERLVNVVKRAIEISEIDFVVIEGLRTKERQAQLLKAGATRTMNSKHIVGKAVDLAAIVDGSVRWDWPLYAKLADAMKRAAEILNVEIEWGGDWITFKDGPHFQLKD